MNQIVKEYIKKHFPLDILREKSGKNVLDVECFLRRLHCFDRLDSKQKKDFDFISKRAEVYQKIHKKYEGYCPVSDRPTSKDVCSLFLCQCLLMYFMEKDMRYINTILKVVEYGLVLPEYRPSLDFRLFLEGFLLDVL